MKQIIILNGPPGCGKDTIAEKLGYPTAMFKEQLYKSTAEYFELKLHLAMEYFTDRELKEKNSILFEGYSPRGALIHVSEDIIKPKYGKGFFGRQLANKALRILETADTVIVTDGGFIEEVEEVCDQIDRTGSNVKVKIVQITRPDCSFEGDSRNYIEVARGDVSTYRVGLIIDDIENAVESLQAVIEDKE